MSDTHDEERHVRATSGNIFAERLSGTREQLREIEIEKYREKIRTGMQSGSGIPADEVLNRLETKYQAMIEQQP